MPFPIPQEQYPLVTEQQGPSKQLFPDMPPGTLQAFIISQFVYKMVEREG